MATLENRSVSETYKDLLQVSNSNSGIDTTARVVSDGEGTDSILYLSTGKVGVGRSPNTKFAVQTDTNKNINFSASSMGNIAGILARNDGNDTMVALGIAGSPIQFSIDGTNDKMRLDSTGLGIGVAPTKALTVKSSGADDGILFLESTGTTLATLFQSGDASGYPFLDLHDGAGDTKPDNVKVRLNSGGDSFINGGNLGIGTISPQKLVHLDASSGFAEMRLSGTSGGGTVEFYNDSTALGDMFFDTSKKFHVRTNGATTALTIDENQNIGIGHDLSSHTQRLVVKKNASATTLTAGAMLNLVNEQGAGNTASIRFSGSQQNAFLGFFDGSSTATQRIAIGVGSGGTGDGHLNVTANGTVGVGSTNPQSSLVVSSGNNTGIEFSPDHSNTRVNMFVIDRTASAYENLRIDAETTTFRTTSDQVTLNTAMVLEGDGTTNQQGQYTVNEQGRQNHVANTMSSPYYRFDGVDDKIDCGNNFDFSSGDFAISAWVYYIANTSAGGIVGIRANGATPAELQLYIENSTLKSWNGTTNISSTASIPDQKWTHIVMVQDGSNKLFYINGVLDSTQSQANGASSSETLKIGYTGHASEYFKGSISCVRAFNYSLDATEVKELYSGMSVPYKYKGANQTDLVTNGGFDSNTNDWDGQNATLSVESGGQSGNCLKVLQTTGSSAYASQDITTIIGKRYRFSFFVKQGNNANGGHARVGTSQFGNEVSGDLSFAVTGSFVQHSIEFTATTTTSYIQVASGFTANTYQLYDTITCVPIGAVAEYDGSGIASDKWFDKSGNDLHGSVTGASVENAPSGDDGLIYEEGTFTVDNNSDASGTFSAQIGEYVRIGNMVHVRVCVTVSANFASNTFSGLPYVCNNSASPSSLLGGFGVLTGADGEHQNITASPGATSTTINLFDGNNAGDIHTPTAGPSGHGTYRMFLSYMT